MSGARKICFDLDGTLVDASDRLYHLFAALVPECDLDKRAYWTLKRDKVVHSRILRERYGYSDAAVADFERRWLAEIESAPSLARDRAYPDVIAVLRELRRRGHRLYLVTARQFPDAVREELGRLGLASCLDGIGVTGPDRDKAREIRAFGPFAPGDMMVGDTGHEVCLGRAFGLVTVACTYGFLSEGRLREYAPDALIGSPSDLLSLDCPSRT